MRNRTTIHDTIRCGNLPFYVITESDIGRTIGFYGEGMGHVLPCDVGKRVFICVSESGYKHTCMENNEQRDHRIAS